MHSLGSEMHDKKKKKETKQGKKWSEVKWSEVKWSESRSVVSDSLWPHGLYSPWNSPDQYTGVGSLSKTIVTAATKLKDAYSLEGKLWPS